MINSTFVGVENYFATCLTEFSRGDERCVKSRHDVRFCHWCWQPGDVEVAGVGGFDDLPVREFDS